MKRLNIAKAVDLQQTLRHAGQCGKRHWLELRTRCNDTGSATAEYAIATLAACSFAALLVTVLRSSQVRALLFGIIKRALALG